VSSRGVHASTGDALVFLDADTLIQDSLLQAIAATLGDDRCFGSAVTVRYSDLKRRLIPCYLKG